MLIRVIFGDEIWRSVAVLQVRKDPLTRQVHSRVPHNISDSSISNKFGLLIQCIHFPKTVNTFWGHNMEKIIPFRKYTCSS